MQGATLWQDWSQTEVCETKIKLQICVMNKANILRGI